MTILVLERKYGGFLIGYTWSKVFFDKEEQVYFPEIKDKDNFFRAQESISTTIDRTMIMQALYSVVSILIALIAIQIGNTAFGQSNQTTERLSTVECVHYKGTNLIIVKISYPPLESSINCEEELDRQIASFHPSGITVSTLESVLYQGGDIHRSDVVYLIK